MVSKKVAVILAVLLFFSLVGCAFAADYIKPRDLPFLNFSPQIQQEEIQCLAQNVYYEAGNQPWQGQVAVAYVTLNRVRNPKFPFTICGVVQERHQFSWVNYIRAHTQRRHRHFLMIYGPRFEECLKVAEYVLRNYDKNVDPTHGADYYHATYIHPRWGNWKVRYVPTVTIGDHIFFREVRLEQ